MRSVSDDGNWVAVEGSKTGIPMSQVRAYHPPPVFEFDDPKPKTSDKENDIKITLDGSKLQMVGHNIDIAGVALLRRQLEKYEEILKLMTPTEE